MGALSHGHGHGHGQGQGWRDDMVEPLNELKDALEKTERVLFEQYIEIAQLKAKLKTLEEKTREVEARTIKNNINRFIETIDVTADADRAFALALAIIESLQQTAKEALSGEEANGI